MNNIPRPRTEGIVEQEAGSEILIYNLTSNKAFCLNETTSRVWRNLDGRTSVEEIAAVTKMDPLLVSLAIEQIEKNGFLEPGFETGLPKETVSRRRAILTLGLSVLLPTIVAVVAPTAVDAASACLLAAPGTVLTSISLGNNPTCVANCSTSPGGACASTNPNSCCSGAITASCQGVFCRCSCV